MPLPLLPLLTAVPGIAKIFGGGAKGASDERTQQNQFATNANQAANSQYATGQNAAIQALLGKSNEATNRYNTRQQATTGAMTGLQGATTTALENQSKEGIDLAKLGMDAPIANARQSILGSMMKNMTPHSFASPARQKGHLTQMSGGLSAANLDPTTRAQGDELIKSAMASQLNGGGIPQKTNFMGGVQDWKSTLLDAPTATDYSKGLLNPPEMQGYKNAGKMESGMGLAGMGLGILGQLLPGLTGQPNTLDETDD